MGEVNFNWFLFTGVIFIFSLLVTVNALLLQSVYVGERRERLGSLGELAPAPQLIYVEPGRWKLSAGALLFSAVLAIVGAVVLVFGFGARGSGPPIDLATQVAEALLFVIVPAYFASLIRIYFFAMRGSLSTRTFLEATTALVLVCLAAASLWLICAVPGGLAPVGAEGQPIVLFLSFAIGLVPLVPLALSERMRFYDRKAHWQIAGVRGLDAVHTAKLYEAGVRNLHNLASADPGALFTITGLQLLWIVEWVAEAQLSVLIGAADDGKAAKRLEALRGLGISNILDLTKSLERPESQGDVLWALDPTDDSVLSKKKTGPIPRAISMRSTIESDPAFKVLQKYADAVEKPPTPVNDVARAVKTLIEGPPLSNYSGFVGLSTSKDAKREGNRWRGKLVFSSKKPQADTIAEVQIADGKPSDGRNAEVEFDVRVNFRPPTNAPRVLKILAPLKGESQPQFFDVEGESGTQPEILVRIFQANILIQSLTAVMEGDTAGEILA